MTYLITPIIILATLAAIFLFVPARSLAQFIRSYLPPVLMAAGAALMLVRVPAVGAGVVLLGFVLWRSFRKRGPKKSSNMNKRFSTLRTACLEMEINHKTGEMNGVVLVGTFEGKELNTMSESDLTALLIEVSEDSQTLELLNTYLDSRFSRGRENAQPDGGTGEAGASGTGTMGEEEAYEVLGLSFGARASEIRKAHRRLIKSVQPDSGGSVFLAAKINEAKDVLLRSHS